MEPKRESRKSGVAVKICGGESGQGERRRKKRTRPVPLCLRKRWKRCRGDRKLTLKISVKIQPGFRAISICRSMRIDMSSFPTFPI